MLKTVKFLVLSLILSTFMTTVYADNSKYSAQVPVTNNSKAQWQQGTQQALQQILSQITGNPGISNLPAIKNALPKAGDIVQSFSYSTVKQNDQSQLMLEVNFDPKSVEQLVNRIGSKAWQKQPVQGLLTWLVINDNNKEQFISSDTTNNFDAVLQTAAQQKNLTLTLPVIDLTDLNALTTNDIATLEPTPIIQASKRYQTQNILAGYISEISTSNNWQGNWWLLYNGKNTQFQTQGSNPSDVITKGMNIVANNIMPSTPITASNNTDTNKDQISLKITNVSGLADYAEVLKYLRSLLSVTQVDIDNVQGEDLLVKVTTSEQSILLAQLAQSQKLIADPAAGDASLTYRWTNTLPANSNQETNISQENTQSTANDISKSADSNIINNNSGNTEITP